MTLSCGSGRNCTVALALDASLSGRTRTDHRARASSGLSRPAADTPRYEKSLSGRETGPRLRAAPGPRRHFDLDFNVSGTVFLKQFQTVGLVRGDQTGTTRPP